MTTLDVVKLLGGKSVLGHEIDNDLELAEAVDAGLPSGSIRAFMSSAHFTALDLDPVIPKRTLMDAQKRDRLSPEQSDRLVRIARLLHLAEETLGSPEKARTWLSRTNRALGGKRPIDLVRRSSGALVVEQVLGRLSYGVYS